MGEVVNLFNGKLSGAVCDTEKKAIFLSKMEKDITYLVLDARHKHAVVPDDFKESAGLTLKFSYRFAPGDVQITDFGVMATLSFLGRPFSVNVPWGAVWRIENVLWPEDVPGEVMLVINPPQQMVEEEAKKGSEPEDEKKANDE